jgi:hypothetical protein
MSKTKEDFRASKAILKANLDLFEGGARDVYRVIAVELRKLMCDRPQPLLLRVFREVPLHKLYLTELLDLSPSLAAGLDNHIPGRLTCDTDGRAVFRLLFAKSKARLPLKEWIQQPCFNPKITIYDLIKSVADKQGAHADPDYNETLRHARLWRLIDDESHTMVVCGIATYLLEYLEREKLEKLEDANPSP